MPPAATVPTAKAAMAILLVTNAVMKDKCCPPSVETLDSWVWSHKAVIDERARKVTAGSKLPACAEDDTGSPVSCTQRSAATPPVTPASILLRGNHF